MDNTNLVARLAADDRFSERLGIDLVEASFDRVVVRCRIEGWHLNFNASCHGGVIFSLADAAFGFASNAAGTMASGISASIIFTSAANVGDTLTATAVEISRSRKLANYRVDVINQKDVLIASFTGVVYLKSPVERALIAARKTLWDYELLQYSFSKFWAPCLFSRALGRLFDKTSRSISWLLRRLNLIRLGEAEHWRAPYAGLHNSHNRPVF